MITSARLPMIILLSILAGRPDFVKGQAEKRPESFPAGQIIDKIRGGKLGQILGNLNGLPHEMAYINEPGGVKNYVPSLKDGAWTDDDTDTIRNFGKEGTGYVLHDGSKSRK